jgi:hypothetical protein
MALAVAFGELLVGAGAGLNVPGDVGHNAGKIFVQSEVGRRERETKDRESYKRPRFGSSHFGANLVFSPRKCNSPMDSWRGMFEICAVVCIMEAA